MRHKDDAVAIRVVTTLPAVPPVRKQKSIAFSMLSPKIKIFGDPVKKIPQNLQMWDFFCIFVQYIAHHERTMREVKNKLYIMKRYLSILLAAIALLGLNRQQARANDYMEHTENYTVYASGIDKIHFSIPVWVHGAWYERSYLTLPGSQFSYVYKDDHVVIIRNKQKYDVTGIKL